ncbi:ABC transporter ATP-binding protein [Paenibacillus sp. SC116]|uniref:ABC transporter ATP-binding protein n=1 Tax=Paenibacillus sp. SC116 TaxID=2968986 RepID=UPI00215A2F22|nr:ABC transporter ATP-binding protein [Paenibacillus sp. SC116]MCR8845713.1 ABC transporter ATP-binding protein [Paenibacillus sp. SC116]
MKAIFIFIKSNKLLIISLYTAAFFYFCLLALLTLSMNQSSLELNVAKNYQGKNLYQISDELYNEKERAFFSQLNSFQKLNNFSNELGANQAFTYYTAVWQPIEIANFEGNTVFDAYYESGNNQPAFEINNTSYRTVKSVQMNAAAIELNNLELNEGRKFKDKEYILNENQTKLPIILGTEYSKEYKVGDTINILYYQKQFVGEVIGILKSSQKIMTVQEPELILDRYVILPTLKFESLPSSYGTGIFFKALLLSKINGNIITELNPFQIRSELNNISLRTEFNQFTVIGANGKVIDTIVDMTKMNRNILFIGMTVLLITLIAIFIMVLRVIINKSVEVYKVLLISGYSMEEVAKLIHYKTSLIQFAGLIIPFLLIILIANFSITIIIAYILVSLFSIAVILIVTKLYTRNLINKIDVVRQLKG